MPRSKELYVLLVLFVVMVAGTTWYVIDRRAKNRRAAPPAAAQSPAAAPAAPAPLIERTPPAPVALGTKETERKTIDFSTGQPVVKDSPEDRAALEAAVRDIAEATKDVTFEPEKPAEAPKQ